jgi:hypothetical protein
MTKREMESQEQKQVSHGSHDLNINTSPNPNPNPSPNSEHVSWVLTPPPLSIAAPEHHTSHYSSYHSHFTSPQTLDRLHVFRLKRAELLSDLYDVVLTSKEETTLHNIHLTCLLQLFFKKWMLLMQRKMHLRLIVSIRVTSLHPDSNRSPWTLLHRGRRAGRCQTYHHIATNLMHQRKRLLATALGECIV